MSRLIQQNKRKLNFVHHSSGFAQHTSLIDVLGTDENTVN